ncbi:PepSY-associated TM helix domain-containing protein [Actinokineospora iranica]|uniref:Uncharacterized iron-regulated membrane protein n=1 Tax=Actinokineospora iranica TaxID=1271860 RepID=A0A1G6LEK2_9PSEU|nr:PepSY domain-containing protein [Actinokineospora iranica]SDC41387.1 Uncharacterized iron-regulated membrane protein [Actinokineospora iranica]
MTTTITDPSPPGEEPTPATATTLTSDTTPAGDTATSASDTPEAGATDTRESTLRPGAALRLLARRVHFLAGLFVAPFLAVLCLSGLAYAFSPQINDLFYSDKLSVDVQSGPIRPVSEQVAAALAAYPQGSLRTVIPAPEPDRTTQVVLADPTLKPGDAFSAEMRTVYVDPYTAQVAGDLVTVSNRPPAQVWLREFHGNLHLGEPGRLYSEFVASWLPIIVIGGLVLWIGQRRRKNRVRGLLVPARGLPAGRPRARALHGPLGLWLAIGLLAVSVTGLTWSTYAGGRVDQLIAALDAKSPSLGAPKAAVPAGGERISLDRVVDIARAEGLAGQLTLTPPAAEDKPFKVNESAEGLPVQKDSVAIDPYTGQVTGRMGWQDYPLPAKLTTLGIQAHSGTLLGLANQIALGLLALGTLALLALGYRMWWKRRPAGATFAAAPPTVWRRLPQPVIFLIVLAIGGLGWAMPVFGVTLVAFVALDTARAVVRGTGAGR